KRYLLSFARRDYNDKIYTAKINSYLKKIPETEENYTLLSNIYNILGNTEKINQKPNEALKEFIKADFFAQKNNDTRQHIKIKGNIASIKLDLKQTDDAIKENHEVLRLLEENKNLYEQENYKVIYNIMNSNLGQLYLDKYISDVSRNKTFADSASLNFYQLLRSTQDKRLIAGTYLRLGTLNNKKKKYPEATEYYLKSLADYKRLKYKDEVLNTQYNMSVNYYESGLYKESKQGFLELSEQMEKDSLVNTDYIFAQDYLSKIYLKEGKVDSVRFYSNKFFDLYKKNSDLEKKNIADLYKIINSKNLNDEIYKSSSVLRNRLFLIVVLLLLLGATTAYLISQIKKKKRTEKRLDEILLQVKNNTFQATNPVNRNSFTISNEKEAEIINKLLELERKKNYLKPEYNQAYAAKKLDTNTTYLSQTINKYMKKSFSEYTNELRINYILKELSENKKIRNYTTQALAEMVGYKSGISFARTFKEKTGVTPFQYIEKLNKNIE
ncbi:helix-turn-helix domain-containing protein, partial [Chryseobacterium sp.]|uniref:helix-turn-helix domain-containing protein n=1 Tax=Chryseobacterium sp. TaxID=1871047 RepID=UPI00321AD10F